jgi:hypothetical protein
LNYKKLKDTLIFFLLNKFFLLNVSNILLSRVSFPAKNSWTTQVFLSFELHPGVFFTHLFLLNFLIHSITFLPIYQLPVTNINIWQNNIYNIHLWKEPNVSDSSANSTFVWSLHASTRQNSPNNPIRRNGKCYFHYHHVSLIQEPLQTNNHIPWLIPYHESMIAKEQVCMRYPNESTWFCIISYNPKPFSLSPCIEKPVIMLDQLNDSIHHASTL